MTLLLTTPWPLRSPGGGQHLAHGIAGVLAAQGVEVVVAAGSGLTNRTYDVVRDCGFREVRLQLARNASARGLGRRSAAEFSLEGLEALADAIRPRALLFTPHYSSCALQSRAIADRLEVPFVMWPAIHLDYDAHTSADARQFYRSTDRILCMSPIERDWLASVVGIPPARLLLTGYPWQGPVQASSRRFQRGAPVRLLTVGAFVRHKQLDDQLEALALLRHDHLMDARLTLAGAGLEPSVLSDLEHLVKRLRLTEHVQFAVDSSDADIADLYESADAFLFTSRSESFGVAVLEAIARATPPIVYPRQAYCGLVDASAFGSVAATSTPAALAAAIAGTLAANLRESDAQRRTFLAQHSPARVGAALAMMLEQLETERTARA